MQTCRNCEINARMCIDCIRADLPIDIHTYLHTYTPTTTYMPKPTYHTHIRTLHCITLPAHALHYITLHYMSLHYVILLYFTFHWGVHTSMHTHTYMNLYIILSQTCIHPSMHTDNQVLPTLPYTCLCTTYTCLCTSALVHIVRYIRSIPFHVVACAIIAYLHTYLTCIHAHTCIHRRIHTCIHAYMHTCLNAYMDTYMHTCLNAYMHS